MQRRKRKYKKKPLRIFAGVLVVTAILFTVVPKLTDMVANIVRPTEDDSGSLQGNTKNSSSNLEEKIKLIAKTQPEAKKILNNMGEYPDEILELLVHNPETAEFAAGYPERGDKKRIDITHDYKKGTIPYFLQWDKRWGYDNYGDSMIALSGCGPTCLSMVYVGLTGDTSKNPKVLCDESYQNGYYIKGAGTAWDLMTTGAENLGLTSKEISLDESSMKQELSSGHPLILSLRKGDFTLNGHFIVVTGVDSYGDFKVLDPNSKERSEKTWSMKTLHPQISNIWSFTKR